LTKALAVAELALLLSLHSSTSIMATTTATVTTTVDELSLQLSRLGVEDELPQVNGTDVLARPTDIFRSHLAGLLVDALQCDVNLAYGAIAESAMSDLEVRIPKLKLGNRGDPAEVIHKVSETIVHNKAKTY
jgi:hypothetical protein